MEFASNAPLEGAETVLNRSIFDLGRELGITRHIDLKALDTVLASLEQPGSQAYLLNVSRDTILDSDWMTRLATGLAATDDAAPRLVIGIAEVFALSGKPEAEAFLKALASLGCGIRINRFSASPAAFNRLQSVPAHIVLLDEEVMRWVESNPMSSHCLDHIENVAASMNLEVHRPV